MEDKSPESIKAIVLLRVDSRIEKQVIDEIRTFEGVKEAHYIFGPYDMYVECELDDSTLLRELVLNKIRNLPGIISSTTCYYAE